MMESEHDVDIILWVGKISSDHFQWVENDWVWKIIYIRRDKTKLRTDKYKSLVDVVARGGVDPSSAGWHIILPSTFQGVLDSWTNCNMMTWAFVEHIFPRHFYHVDMQSLMARGNISINYISNYIPKLFTSS